MWIDDDLPAQVTAQIEPLCESGNRLADQGQYAAAIEQYKAALNVLPHPTNQWLAATYLLILIGDSAYLAGDISKATETFADIALDYPGCTESPLFWLRRGQIALDQFDEKKASNCLSSAFMLAGYGIFESEDEKYARFILGQIDSPVPPIKHPLARFHRDRLNASAKPWWRFW